MPHLGHVFTDAATVDVTVGVLVSIPAGVLTGLAVATMDEAIPCAVVDVTYTACIALFKLVMGVDDKLLMAVDDIVLVHTVRDIDPDEPTNISLFRAVE